MKKSIFSFILLINILILNINSVFALESYTLECFSETTYLEDDTGERLDFINTYKDSYPYIYYIHIAYNYSSTHSRLIASTGPVEITAPSSRDIAFINNGTEDITIISHSSTFNNITVAAGETSANIRYHSITGTNGMYDDTGLLIYNGDCVNSTHCSPDIYVEFKEDTGDYEEDGVVIKGLTAFFNKITSSIDGIVDDLISKLKELVGLPPEGYFISKFEEIKTNLDNKYNFSSVFEIFNNLKSIQAQKPYFDKTFTFSFADIDIPFHFKIDFDFIDSIRDYLFAFIRAFGYFYLIIYNMNQYYLLFRGQRFFYDMRDSYSYTDSNGKEHSHERGEKKWY